MLNVLGLGVSIHGQAILQDVSFAIGRGEVFGLVGESGSGKSMMALALMRLLPRGMSAQGWAEFDGVDLLGASERRMCGLRGREIGMIFQEPMTALNPVQRIGDQVAETLLVHGAVARSEAWGMAAKRLARVGLDPERVPMDRYPHELSGGQRQRVCIAMAVALRPKLLIADEPTTALDVTTQAQILDLLRGLVEEEGMSLMLITHDLAVVADMADQVAVMRAGRIVEAGRTEALFRGRTHPYTAQLFADSAHVPQREAQSRDVPVLEARGMVRDYALPRQTLLGARGTFRAVDHVDLVVNVGESVGLVGESGCGKSTLTRAILGLEALQGGSVRLDGDEILAGQVDGGVRAKMQVVFQDPYGSFNPRHRVGRLVAEPFHLMPQRRAEVEAAVVEALQAVGLTAEDREKFIHEFSGGQRQRIAIARAIVIRPKLVILDEAVSALDVTIRAQILDLLADLQARFGLSYLFISHDLSVVRAITDRVLVMQNGQIVEQGETERVFSSPQHAYTQQLIAATPKIPAEWLAA
jgi:peptide/nickel transport system ATP-binding protein